MLSKIMDLFTSQTKQEDRLTTDQLHIATCALLLEVARGEVSKGDDSEFTDDERTRIVETLNELYGLSDDDAQELIQAANDGAQPGEMISCIEQLSQPPTFAMNEAADDFEGPISELCGRCYGDLHEAAWVIAQA